MSILGPIFSSFSFFSTEKYTVVGLLRKSSIRQTTIIESIRDSSTTDLSASGGSDMRSKSPKTVSYDREALLRTAERTGTVTIGRVRGSFSAGSGKYRGTRLCCIL